MKHKFATLFMVSLHGFLILLLLAFGEYTNLFVLLAILLNIVGIFLWSIFAYVTNRKRSATEQPAQPLPRGITL
jgi:hypothetical protein